MWRVEGVDPKISRALLARVPAIGPSTLSIPSIPSTKDKS